MYKITSDFKTKCFVKIELKKLTEIYINADFKTKCFVKIELKN